MSKAGQWNIRHLQHSRDWTHIPQKSQTRHDTKCSTQILSVTRRKQQLLGSSTRISYQCTHFLSLEQGLGLLHPWLSIGVAVGTTDNSTPTYILKGNTVASEIRIHDIYIPTWLIGSKHFI